MTVRASEQRHPDVCSGRQGYDSDRGSARRSVHTSSLVEHEHRAKNKQPAEPTRQSPRRPQAARTGPGADADVAGAAAGSERRSLLSSQAQH